MPCVISVPVRRFTLDRGADRPYTPGRCRLLAWLVSFNRGWESGHWTVRRSKERPVVFFFPERKCVNLLYLDESGDTGRTGTDHFVLGAAALFEGMIIVDPRNSALSKALRNSVLQFHETGTPWAALENVIESVIFLESQGSPES